MLCIALRTMEETNLTIRLKVDGKLHVLGSSDPRITLLDALREHLGITGPKKGCDHGQCGACTVRVNGRRINACLSLAVSHEDDEIETVHSLETEGGLHVLQDAFIELDAFQCGFCTAGQLCSARALLDEVANGEPSVLTDGELTRPLSKHEIRERMSGNLCRCGAYAHIVDAIASVLASHE